MPRQTASVPTFTLAISVRLDAVPDDDVVDSGSTLRPGDGNLLAWRDADPTVLRMSTDCPAADLDAALAVGLELADDVLALGLSGAVEEVVAMDDERQLVWRREP
jgi:hypothetical protein